MKPRRDWYIFDLDGTLYDFWWVWFSDSLLGQAVRERYYDIISHFSLWEPESYYRYMVERERSENIGISLQVATLLWIPRKEVLQTVWWNIDPEKVVKNFSVSQNILRELYELWKLLFLVTAAPSVWATHAWEYMHIRAYFTSILTLEDFVSSKKEAFTKISHSSGIPFENLISIGDQMHSDIIPAEELSMQTLHVRWPQDLIPLLAYE